MAATDEPAILGTIGRKRLCFALSGIDGLLQTSTIRTYDVGTTTGVSAALMSFQRDIGLANLPRRSAIAVAGLARGDAISITHTRWFLSRSGLNAMLGQPPLILNDFAAEAWGMCSAGARMQESFGGDAKPNLQTPGCYVVLGITSGLGVAVLNRSQTGTVTVLPTEAGHSAFAAVSEELAQLVSDLTANRHPAATEEIVSAPGLLSIYNLIAKRRGASPRARTPEDITRTVQSDPIARAACEMLSRAFWAQAGNLVMTFGAWDGVIVTGKLATAMRPILAQASAQALFAVSAKHRRVLEGVPRTLITLEHAELVGVAEALRGAS
ncbi:glucokinase [Sphingomonas sp. S1-29]|uniref:glucokinase n=1 Tax=Sphingomonas sp. S1-29 TaxID=2991074 RepID=UPI00223FB4E0|nr:glucokinase [Sphingomonas sp. S1-29]UZK68798.1 glucokinase [Sphingomonas sp. S1-29]